MKPGTFFAFKDCNDNDICIAIDYYLQVYQIDEIDTIIKFFNINKGFVCDRALNFYENETYLGMAKIKFL